MNAKSTEDGATALAESEARFRAALGRMADALREVNGVRNQLAKLTSENETLREGLERLKGDYEGLEKSYLELKEGEAENGSDSVDQELARLREDYDAMEHAHNLLKAQYLEAREETDSARRELKTLKAQKIIANGAAGSGDAAIAEMKAGIVAQLDSTIGRIERVLGANDA